MFYLLTLPFRIVFGALCLLLALPFVLLALPFALLALPFLLLRLVFKAVFALVMLPIVFFVAVVVFAAVAIAVALAVLAPLAPFLLIALVVWAVTRSSRAAIATQG
jgi:hypothetical protein